MAVPQHPVIQGLLRDSTVESIDTSPAVLHFSQEDDPKDSSSTKARVKRAVEKTVDKLGKGIPSKAPPSPPVSGASRRLFSISRKSKRKESDNFEGERSGQNNR
jgi:hypothetical protein